MELSNITLEEKIRQMLCFAFNGITYIQQYFLAFLKNYPDVTMIIDQKTGSLL